jgi:hypothetical protein
VLEALPVPGGWALAAERYAHWLLREHHLRGEWFNVSITQARAAISAAAQRDYDAMVRQQYLIPPAVVPGQIRYAEHTKNRFAAGTMLRIDAVGAPSRADFVREAVERELKRREALKRKPERRS